MDPNVVDAAQLFSVKGLVAVITGGGFKTGIGLMMTKALASNGASKVYIVGRRKAVLDEAAALHPDIIVPVMGDVTSKDSLTQIAEQVKQEVDTLEARGGHGHILLLPRRAPGTGRHGGAETSSPPQSTPTHIRVACLERE